MRESIDVSASVRWYARVIFVADDTIVRIEVVAIWATIDVTSGI